MEDNDIDLYNLKIVEENKENLETKTNTEKLGKKIIKIQIPDQHSLPDVHKTELPLIIHFSDGTEKLVLAPFDKYFQLLHRFMWNCPNYSQNADLITMEERMKDAAPYNLFFNTLKYFPETNDQLHSVSFTDLLCPSFGKLKCSCQITHKADLKWILSQFAKRNLHELPMTILYGYPEIPWPKKEIMEQLYPKIDYHFIETPGNLPGPGNHHARISIFVYEDNSLRVVLGSANLFAEDWDLYNEQIWISPACPKLPEGSSSMAGESPTGFKIALINYLSSYTEYNIPTLKEWIQRVENADFSEVKVALLFTVPGVHFPRKNGCLLHFIGHILSRDCTIPAPKQEHDSWPVIVQSTSLGLLGKDPEEWLTTHLLKTLGSHKDSPYFPTLPIVSKIQFNLIFPTIQNAIDSYLGVISATCSRYDEEVKETQPWLRQYQCQWKADGTKRTLVMSHCKSYSRISPCYQKMAYYFLTSSNLSRSGWGRVLDQNSGISQRCYGLGVLFLPKYFGEEYFEIKDFPARKNKKLFPLIYDLPPTPYGPDDEPFYTELLPAREWRNQKSEDETENYETKDNIDKSKEKSKVGSSTDLIKPSNEVPSPSDKTKAVNKWDENPSKTTETTKKNMKYNAMPGPNMFFPSFNKKS